MKLGCLQEENAELKRDKDDMHENYEQRLKDQRARMETELLSSHEEV